MKLRWKHFFHVAWVTALITAVALIFIWNTGLANLWLRRYAVGGHQLLLMSTRNLRTGPSHDRERPGGQ